MRDLEERLHVAMFTSFFSGRNILNRRRIKNLEKVRGRAVKNGGNSCDIFITQNLRELEDRIRRLYDTHPDMVVIDGGDGTFSLIVDLLMKYWPEGEPLPYFGLLPGGTFNMMAEFTQVKKWDEGHFFYDLLTAKSLKKLKVKDMDMLKVRDDRGVDKYSFSAGVGLPVTILEEAYKRKRMKWLRLAAMGIHLKFSQAARGEYYEKFSKCYDLDVNGDCGDWWGLMAQTIATIGLGSKPFYLAEDSSGAFHTMGTKKNMLDNSLGEILYLAYGLYKGMGHLIESNLDLNERTDYLEVKAKDPFPFHVSGDVVNSNGKRFEANELEIRHGTSIKLIKPNPSIIPRLDDHYIMEEEDYGLAGAFSRELPDGVKKFC